MSTFFPVQRSILHEQEVGQYVQREYSTGQTATCSLFNIGPNDTYVLRIASNERYVLRIARTNKSALRRIHYETDALCHLRDKGVPVAAPVASKDGRFVGTIEAPEGPRDTCLFEFAPGIELTYQDAGQATLYGRAVAALHAASGDFKSQQDRAPLDIENLIDAPLRRIQPFLAERPRDWDYLQKLATGLRQRIHDLPSADLEYGFCHGDLHGWNAHISQEGIVTFFDFDCCGPGWRAYDLATFLWAATLRGKQDERWPLYIQGYTERRSIRQTDVKAAQLLVGVRHLWCMGYHAEQACDLGAGWLNDEYYDREVGFLRQWGADILKDMNAG